MFIATSARPRIFAPLGARPGSGTFAEQGTSDCAPPELRSKDKDSQGYKHLAPLGRSDNQCSVALPV